MTTAIKDPFVASTTQTPRELLPGFYKQYHLSDDGGQTSPHVRVELTKKICLYFPNFDARRKAIFKHDVHHIATGYESTYKGETEIGAWEIASGCRQYWVAFVLDMSAVMTGLLFNPFGVYKAFVRGRRTKNLYNDELTEQQVMDMPLCSIKEKLLLDQYPGNSAGNLLDLFLFITLVLFGLIYAVLSLLLLPPVLIYSMYVILMKRQ